MTLDAAFDGAFQPWIGPAYADGVGAAGRTLVLVEGHPLPPEADHAHPPVDVAFTRRLVAREVETGGADPALQHLTALVSPDGQPDAALWQRLALVSALPRFAGDGPRPRGDGLAWADAEATLPERLAVLRPHLVVVAGFELWKHVRVVLGARAEQVGKRQRRLDRLAALHPDGGEDPCTVVGIMDPAAHGFKPEQWRPVVQAHLAAAPPARP